MRQTIHIRCNNSVTKVYNDRKTVGDFDFKHNYLAVFRFNISQVIANREESDTRAQLNFRSGSDNQD